MTGPFILIRPVWKVSRTSSGTALQGLRHVHRAVAERARQQPGAEQGEGFDGPPVPAGPVVVAPGGGAVD
ncbi:hypothetical protein [Micromonospora rhizosphaerae]|uniref:hypothetical protein n=1 Tax=Micromonospora rhizosphaerae TaxID=568872 RepID=UPI001C403B08|nr:hypothetical protein [Micromonospora rhizosphaerae]